MLKDPKLISCLNILQEQYVIDLWTKMQITLHLYVRIIHMSEYSYKIQDTTSNTYQQVNDTLHNVLQQQKII